MKRFTTILVILMILLAGFNEADAQELQYVTASMWAGEYGVKVVDSYAYCSFFSGLVILDLSDPHDPVEVSRLYCQGNGLGVDVNGDYAFLADDCAGLQIIDVSDPHQPIIAACYDTPGRASDVTVRDSLAYVADGPGAGSGLLILDVSDPTTPAYLGSYSAGGMSEKCTIAGDYAYIGGIYYGLDIVNISDPTNPTLVIRYEMCSSDQVCVRGTTAYATAGCGGGDGRPDEYTIMHIFDVSEPAQPVPLGDYYCEGWGNGPVQVSGDYAYIRERDEDGTNWVVVVDVSDPSQPVRVGATKVDGCLRDLQIEGETIYAAMGGGGFQIFDINTATDPQLRGVWWEARGPDGVAVNGEVAYVADGLGGLRVLDVSNPETPINIGRLSMPGSQRDVQVAGNQLYLVDFIDRFSIVDVSDPTAPRVLSTIESRVYAAHVHEGFAYLVEGGDGLFIYDISDPQHPTEVGWCAVPGNAWNVLVSNGFAYVCAFEGGLQIVDVSDPAQPILRGGISFDHMYFMALAKVTDLVFVPAGYSTLFILDVSDPDHPILEHGYPMHCSSDFVHADGNRLFLGTFSDEYAAELTVLDISDPLQPVEWTPYLISGHTGDLDVFGEFILVATLGSLLVLQGPTAGAHEPNPKPCGNLIELHLSNPALGRADIRFTSPGAVHARVDMIDLAGRHRARLYEGRAPNGEVRLDWDWRAAGFEAGTYFVRVSADERIATSAITLVR